MRESIPLSCPFDQAAFAEDFSDTETERILLPNDVVRSDAGGGSPWAYEFKESQPGDTATRFQAISGFEYASSEGKQSKKDKSIRVSRRISVNGNHYELWPHIKLGNRPPKLLRVNFAFDEDQKKIVIGHVGMHLKNATTKSMKH